MPNQLAKLQPHRTMALRGFDALGASAALHSATANSFIVSGTFRDSADFAVLMVYDADNFYEHPRLKYLPDFNFDGATLAFDVAFTPGLQPLDSPKSNWIDWATLDYVPTSGKPGQLRIWDNCMLKSGDFAAASGTFHLQTNSGGMQPADRLTIFFQNFQFDYQAASNQNSVEYFFYVDAGMVHSITVNGRVYTHTQADPTGESSVMQANSLVALINAGSGDPDVIAAIGSKENAVLLTVRPNRFAAISASDNNVGTSLGSASLSDVAASLAQQINGYNWWTPNPTHAIRATVNGAALTVTAARYGFVSTNGSSVTLASGCVFTGLVPGATVTIAGTLYTIASVDSPTALTLTGSAGTQSNVKYVADRGGVDGNMIELYALSASKSLTTVEPAVRLSGGNSQVTWTCTIDFTKNQITSLRQCWFTYAAALANGKAFTTTEWSATYSNWQFTGPDAATQLWVAGPGSVRMEEDSAACTYTGEWATPAPESGFFSLGLARRAGQLAYCSLSFYAQGTGKPHFININGRVYTHVEADPAGGSSATQATALIALVNAAAGDPDVIAAVGSTPYSVKITARSGHSATVSATGYAPVSIGAVSNETLTVAYKCPATHTLYLGTSLYTDRATILVSVDGAAEFPFSLHLSNEPEVNTRRALLPTSLPAGTHTVSFRLRDLGYFYFDFLEAAVLSDVPPVPVTRPDLSPALDYSTDHSWKLPPARILWILDNLGFTGPVNQYIGVFWWNQRTNPTAVLATASVTFPAPGSPGSVIELKLGDTAIDKTILPADTPDTVAAHFARYINTVFVGVWAAASGPILTVTVRSPAYSFTFTAGTLHIEGSLAYFGSAPGIWMVDPAQSPALNRGARDWHADLYRECKLRNREVTTSGSMELVNPPDGFAAMYPGNTPVVTDVGFGNLHSTHCAQSSPMRAFQQSVFDCIVDLQNAAGLIPNFQLGEYLWWFFSNPKGMAFYDAETAAAAQAALGRPLHLFLGPNDDPTVNASADALFLRNRLRDHCAAIITHVRSRYPNAVAEILFPYDVNYPTPNQDQFGSLGGALNRFINFPAEWS